MIRPSRSNGFTRKDRLLTAHQFTSVFRKPVKSADRAFTILATKNQGELARIGIIVAKKNVKLAVNRHRIKRVIRESFRVNKHRLGHYDIVVICKKSTALLANNILSDLLTKQWKRFGEHPTNATD